MRKETRLLREGGFALSMVVAAFFLNLILMELFETRGSIESVFVLAVFLVALRTEGYVWGMVASLVSVLAVNYTFTYPYWAFDLISPECIASALVMLIVAGITSTLTTQLKAQEKMKAEAEKERMRGNLLRAVSHDLRTPLTSIYGACSAMVENYDDIPRERQRKLLEDMRSDSQWLVRMVENLLSVTRVDAGTVELSKQATVLEELVDALLVKFHKHYPQQRVQVSLPEELVIIPMDAILMEQVLMNLLENAVFHARGMQNLWLIVECRGSKAVFRVRDDGCGIPADRMESLFTGLLDSAAPRDTGRSNMGIGLSVCNTIVRAHGGEMRAYNNPQGGAEFCFALDREETEHGE